MAERSGESCSLIEHFALITDPRQPYKVLYPLEEILLVTVCAVIGGADNWVEVEMFGRAKEEFLKKLVPLEHGIPSHDTFGDVFAAINPEEFKTCFVRWTESLCKQIKDIVAIDGKTLRRSHDRANDKPAIHMVSAWARGQHLVLGQERVANKSNEITAIPKLLEVLDLSSCIVTIDAMGCQKNIAEQIIHKDADYVLALKGNQGELHEDVKLLLEEQRSCDYNDIQVDAYESTDADHGRIEERCYFITEDIDWLKAKHAWPGLRSIGFVVATREVNNQVSAETRYYISSLAPDAQAFAEAVRGHWGIENSLHWVLDVNFKDDICRIRKDNAPQNFTIIKHMAYNLFQKERSSKKSMNSKRRLAGWDEQYLLRLLCQ